MRCKSCNSALTDYEATRKYHDTHEYVDLCNDCFGKSDINFIVEEREDLMKTEDHFEDLEDVNGIYDNFVGE